MWSFFSFTSSGTSSYFSKQFMSISSPSLICGFISRVCWVEVMPTYLESAFLLSFYLFSIQIIFRAFSVFLFAAPHLCWLVSYFNHPFPHKMSHGFHWEKRRQIQLHACCLLMIWIIHISNQSLTDFERNDVNG